MDLQTQELQIPRLRQQGTPEGTPGLNTTHHTTVHIRHHDGNWNSGLRSLFIFGTGGARLYMSVTRGVSPAQQLFILGSIILAEGASRLIKFVLMDPAYLRA